MLLSVQAHDGIQKEPWEWGSGELEKCLFPAGQCGALTFRLIVSCHCQRETKVCDLSMCSMTALKTDAKPQGSGPATLFEGSADWGWGRHWTSHQRQPGQEGGAGVRQSSKGDSPLLCSVCGVENINASGLWIQVSKDPSGSKLVFL